MNILKSVFHAMTPFKQQLFVTLFAIGLLIVISLMHGCTLLQASIGPEAKKITDYYCAQPLDARLLLREQVEQAIAPATLKLTCPGDPATVPAPATTEKPTAYERRSERDINAGYTEAIYIESVDHLRDAIHLSDITYRRQSASDGVTGSGWVLRSVPI